VSVRALFERSGVIRVETLGDLFDVALLLTSQPLPDGDRVAVVGNSTALGALVSNALDEAKLTLVRLDDIGVDAGSAAFETALRTALDDPQVDAAIVVFVPPLQRESSEKVAVALREVAAASPKPVLSTFLGFEGVPQSLAAPGAVSPPPGSVPSYPSPERAVRALARAVRYSAWRRRDPGVVPTFDDVDVAAGRALVTDVLASAPEGRELSEAEATRLLGAFGVAASSDVSEGVEVVFGAHDDPSFGSLVSFGIRGLATELLGDRSYAAVPLTSADADELIAAPKAAPLLDGYGGGVQADRSALAALALRLSALADALPEVSECVLDVSAGVKGAGVTAARVVIRPPTARADTGPRRLRGM
jgi:acyl-CoA synthetase (NDP forming)